MRGMTFLRWIFWLEVDDGFEEPSSHSWGGPGDMAWPGLGVRCCEQRQGQVQLPGAAAKVCLLVSTEPGTGHGAEQQALHTSGRGWAQVPSVYCTGGVSRRN